MFNSSFSFSQCNSPLPWGYFHCIQWCNDFHARAGKTWDSQRPKINNKNKNNNNKKKRQQTQSVPKHFLMQLGFLTRAQLWLNRKLYRMEQDTESDVWKPDLPDLFCLTSRVIKIIKSPFKLLVLEKENHPRQKTKPKNKPKQKTTSPWERAKASQLVNKPIPAQRSCKKPSYLCHKQVLASSLLSVRVAINLRRPSGVLKESFSSCHPCSVRVPHSSW